MVDEVGRDAVRFMMLYRKNDAVLDFDLAKVIEQSRDNPVFYVQYGHARGHSVFRNARRGFRTCRRRRRRGPRALARAPLERLDDPAELALMRRSGALSAARRSRGAAPMSRTGLPSISMNLQANFTRSGTRGNDAPHLRFIIQNDPQMTMARLALVQGVVTVLASGLALLGVEAPEEMR